MIFRSKINYWLFFAIMMPLFIGFYGDVSGWEIRWPWLVFVASMICIHGYWYYSTFYKIGNGKLSVKSGWWFYKELLIRDIGQIRPKNSVLTAPALSPKRLEIDFKNGEKLMISPRKEKVFLDQLVEINPQIKIMTK
ncbi:PH domain-containing protein [Persicobacter psychrovividus]|uniref:Uncharacterized protein YyaB-like PH domain-containing protein n=1 Tax=Persicobacter psychrovividus TaxID=387638 RepID=A0ABM7VF59_9BACT|nr:hypothetical protein PEPS_18510 [Persicobacter psychrovividus]